MQYDPIKSSLGKVFNNNPFLRKMFYRMLDLLLLRTWHVKREVKKWTKTRAMARSLVTCTLVTVIIAPGKSVRPSR